MSEALAKWNDGGRWDTIWLAGSRDTEPATLFDKIVAKEIPASIVKEDDKILAFKDINPAAPAHVLVIPKDRDGLTRLSKSTPEHYEILGRLMVAAGEIAKDESLGFGDGARIVINDGKAAGQEVFHLHGEYSTVQYSTVHTCLDEPSPWRSVRAPAVYMHEGLPRAHNVFSHNNSFLLLKQPLSTNSSFLKFTFWVAEISAGLQVEVIPL